LTQINHYLAATCDRGPATIQGMASKMNSLRMAIASRAREIIRDPSCWTHSTAARDQQSRPVSPQSTDAQKFCGFGALTRAAHERGLPDRWLIEIFNALALTDVIQVNDRQGHAAVLSCLERIANEA
jgi:propanediol dehydratase large subunit